MQKFALLFLAASTAFLGFLAPVDGQAIVERETNAQRFARGLTPLPPTKRSTTNDVRDHHDGPHPSRYPGDKRDHHDGPRPSRYPGDKRDHHDGPRPSRSPGDKRDHHDGPRPSRTPGDKRDHHDGPRPSRSPNDKRDHHDGPRPSRTPGDKRDHHDGPRPSRSPNDKRSVSNAFQMHQSFVGRLEVRWAANSSIAGFVSNNPSGGSFGLNGPTQFGADDLLVEYFDSNILVLNPEFPSPYFVGGSGAHGCSNNLKVQFANVESGPSSAIWTLDPFSGALNATWTNQDGNENKPSLAYNPAENVLSFTGDFTAPTEYPVYIFLSD